MADKTIGVLFVVAQVVLLGALFLLPNKDEWPTPAWLKLAGVCLVLMGVTLIGLAATGLGSALTPTPLPKPHAQLATQGLYAFVRHPIYTGVLVVVAGLTLRSGSVATLIVALTTVVFFNQKARWEESRLRSKYADYAEYAAETPKFLPRLRRRLRP